MSSIESSQWQKEGQLHSKMQGVHALRLVDCVVKFAAQSVGDFECYEHLSIFRLLGNLTDYEKEIVQ